jgi:hypothetical protein
MKIKWTKIMTLVTLIVGFSYGAVEIEINTGYGFMVGGTLDYKEQTYNSVLNKTISIDNVYSSFGNGVKLGVRGTIYLTQNIGVMLGAGVSAMGGPTRKDTRIDSINTYTTTREYSSTHIPINLGLKGRANIGALSPYAYCTPGIYVPVSFKYKYTSTQPNSSTTETEYSFAPGFGVASGIGFGVKINSNISFNMELFADFATASYKETISETTTSSGKVTTRTTTYVNDKADLTPTQTDANGNTTSEQAGQPNLPFSSAGAKIGIGIKF